MAHQPTFRANPLSPSCCLWLIFAFEAVRSDHEHLAKEIVSDATPRNVHPHRYNRAFWHSQCGTSL